MAAKTVKMTVQYYICKKNNTTLEIKPYSTIYKQFTNQPILIRHNRNDNKLIKYKEWSVFGWLIFFL